MQNRQYPIGPFLGQATYSDDELVSIIDVIESSPAYYRQLVENLSAEELAKTYREVAGPYSNLCTM